MNTIKHTFFALLALGMISTSCKKEATEVATATEINSKKVIAKKATATMKVEGMTCAMGCAKTIENKLANLEGVQKATVDFDKKEATIEYDAELQSIETLSKAIENVADGKTYKVKEAKNI